MSETIPIGSLLTPNEYMVRNSNHTFGIVLEKKSDLHEPRYRVLLSPVLFDKWLSYKTIFDLFDVHRI